MSDATNPRDREERPLDPAPSGPGQGSGVGAHETQALPQIDLGAPATEQGPPTPPPQVPVQAPVTQPAPPVQTPPLGHEYVPGSPATYEPGSGHEYSSPQVQYPPQQAVSPEPGSYQEPGSAGAYGMPQAGGVYEPLQPGGYQPVTPGVPSGESAVTLGGLVGVDIRRERPMLSVRDLEVFYGAARVLKGISFDVYQGEIVTIIGGNGAGKSTTLKTISGVSELLKSVRGKVWFKGRRVDQLPAHKIARLGVAHVPEGRRVFPQSSVEDNLLLGAYRRFKRERRKVRAELDDIYDRFPVLAERRHRAAGLLSGGEQQMLAIARGLMANPEFLLLDEPSLGLAPILVREVFEIINDLAAEGKTILIVEQMAVQALEVADRAYVLETGSITLEGTGQELIEDPRVKAAYLGGV